MDDLAIARGILNKHKGYVYGIYTDALGNELAGRCARDPGIVNLVFRELQAQGYDSNTIIAVARVFIDKTDQATLINIAKTPDGSILLNTVHGILKCDASGNAAAARCLKIQAAYAAQNGSTSVAPVTQANTTSAPRQLTQSEIDFYKAMAKKNGEKFNDKVVWELPVQGTGFVVYNRNDLKDRKSKGGVKDTYGYDQIGTKETVDSMITLAQEWNKLHSDKLLQVGDMSRPGGIDTPDHAGHQNGRIIDLRPLRNDSATGAGANLTYRDSSYHRDLTKEFIRLVRKLHPKAVVRFNDGEIKKEKEFSFIITDSKGIHDNHVHIEI